MSPVLVRSDHQPTTHGDRARRLALGVVVALVAAALLAGLSALVRGPARVARVTVDNQSRYVVDVEVTGAARDGWLGLTAVRPQERLAVHDVVDQGDRWVLHFTSGPHDGGELSLTRAELERSGWRVTVPPGVDAELGAAGAPESPG